MTIFGNIERVCAILFNTMCFFSKYPTITNHVKDLLSISWRLCCFVNFYNVEHHWTILVYTRQYCDDICLKPTIHSKGIMGLGSDNDKWGNVGGIRSSVATCMSMKGKVQTEKDWCQSGLPQCCIILHTWYKCYCWEGFSK